MRNLTAAQIKRVKLVIFLLALLPLLRLIERGVHDNLSANPLEFITRATGDWAMYFLCLTLLITPLRRLTQMNWLLPLRRLLCFFVFFFNFPVNLVFCCYRRDTHRDIHISIGRQGRMGIRERACTVPTRPAARNGRGPTENGRKQTHDWLLKPRCVCVCVCV